MPLLFSRGKLRLAKGGQPSAGLADLLLCGERARKWGSRNPTFLAGAPTQPPSSCRGRPLTQARALVEEDLEALPRGPFPRRRAGDRAQDGRDADAGRDRRVGRYSRPSTSWIPSVPQLEKARALWSSAPLRRRRPASVGRHGSRSLQGRELAHQCGAKVLESPCPRRAAGRRGPTSPAGALRGRLAHAQRAAGRAPGRFRPEQYQHRSAALHNPQDS